MKKPLIVSLLILAASVLLGPSVAFAELKIYYIRHAEGGHNVKADWEHRKVPKDQWPAYVGNPDMFTPKGLAQQAAVSGKLKKYDFDFIAVSPLWRCRNTILPYMKEMDVKGEIWPELLEQRASDLILSTEQPAPTDTIFGEGDAVELPANEAPYFSLRSDGMNNIKLPRYGNTPADDELVNAAARVVIQRVLDMIQDRFGGTDTTILLSGHGSSGKAVLRMLTKDPLDGFPSISNTGIWMAREQANGEFKPMMFNDYPLENGKPSAALKHASMDTNGDGQVTKAEYVAPRAAGFGRKDHNKDGVLSLNEHAHSSFEVADKNQDNQLTPEEYASVFEDQFDQHYDKNGDGVCTVDEMR
ncbi:EF hand [Planctomycetes bacterium CA13]|uniref:EF hand n=1 Tax=Novipirellula herctigrandis TaxID=2527986 RepID=A0A5C5Z082_9BACT|nr:EF hand [Planctomycetes bacterium CA13]